MDIKELIKGSIRQIVEGVKEVQHEIGTKAQMPLKGGSLILISFIRMGMACYRK